MSPLIELKNAYKIYNPGENEVRALDGVNLKLTGAISLPLSVTPARENQRL